MSHPLWYTRRMIIKTDMNIKVRYDEGLDSEEIANYENKHDITPREYAYGKEIVRDSDGSAVIGSYDDNDGYHIRCRD